MDPLPLRSWPNPNAICGWPYFQNAAGLMSVKGSTISGFLGLFRGFSTSGLFPFQKTLDTRFELANCGVVECARTFKPEYQQHIFEQLFRK